MKIFNTLILLMVFTSAFGQYDRMDSLMKINSKFEDQKKVILDDEITLIGNDIVRVEGKAYFAKMKERVGRNIYLIELKGLNGKKLNLILNKKTDTAYIIKGKKILVKYE